MNRGKIFFVSFFTYMIVGVVFIALLSGFQFLLGDEEALYRALFLLFCVPVVGVIGALSDLMDFSTLGKL